MLIAAVLLCIGWSVASCSDDAPAPIATVTPGENAPYQMMVVFAPGQLGDNGYADNIMAGINRLAQAQSDSAAHALDIGFLATYDMDDLATAVSDWAAAPASPLYPADFERRLLVLTEPYLATMLQDIAPLLRPADEVLLLKVNQDDVEAVAERYSLGSRVHGLNISAAASARNYCTLMRRIVESRRKYGEEIRLDTLAFFRLYDTQTMTYHDSIYETLQEEFGTTSNIVTTSVGSQVDADIYSVEQGSSLIEWAFNMANAMQRRYKAGGAAFAFVDLGAGNAGWDYFLLGANLSECYDILMLDVPEALELGRFRIQRQFGEALLQWSSDWARTPVAEMPLQVTHCNRQYCDDDFSFMFE